MPQTSNKLTIPVIVSVIILFITLFGITYRYAIGTAVDARDAKKFVVENHDLPSRVCALERKMEAAMKVINCIDVLQAEQKHIIENMRSLQRALERTLNGKNKDGRRPD